MKKVIKQIFPSLITLTILGIIFYYNDLYPFGSNPLIQVDADYLYIPILYKIHDLLHGIGSVFYTGLGLGSSIYASLIIQGSLYSPLNLLLYLVSKDNIIEFMGIFIIIKMCLVSFTSYIYINYKYKHINYFYQVMFSILYTFNGFMLLNYFNEIWLDIVMLFPILMIYLDKLLQNKGEFGYILVLSLLFIITFYFSYFIIIFLLIYSSIYIYLFVKKENQKQIIFKLGKATVIAFLISAFSSIPLMYQIFISSRYATIRDVGIFDSIMMKSLYILFSPLFIIMFVKLVMKFKMDKRNILKYIILIVVYLIPVIFDPINALLHGGGYWSFPYRYGFITSFILMDASLYYISKYIKTEEMSWKMENAIYMILIIIWGTINYILNFNYKKEIISFGILLDVSDKIYIYMVEMILIVFLMYIFALLIKNKYMKYIGLSMVGIYSIFLFTSWTIYHNKGYFLSTNARKIYSNMEIKHDGRYRVDYEVYCPHYGLMLDVDTLDNWLHIWPDGTADKYKQLGYHPSGSSVYSYGGTIFSDWFLNFKYIFTDYEINNDKMYTHISNYETKNIYQYNYNPNYGVVFNTLDDIEENNVFDYHNSIYHNLFNTNKNIINYIEYNRLTEDNDLIEIDYEIDEPGYLYLDTNDEDVIDHAIINADKYIYNFDDYVKYLGFYEKNANIKLNIRRSAELEFRIGFIKRSDMMSLKSPVEYKDNTYYVNSEGNKYLYLPINNIKGLKVYNNGKEVKTYKYIDNFISIKLDNGENIIKLKYEQPFFKVGLILSLVGIVLLIFNNKIQTNNAIILNISYYIYGVLIIGMYLYYYVYSFFKYLLR